MRKATISAAPRHSTATDFTRLMWRHGANLDIMMLESRGLEVGAVEDVLRVVSPLALEPKVPHERRFLFGGTADRLVPPDQVRDLWAHWDKPKIRWYQGAHVTFQLDARVRQMVKRVLSERLLADEAQVA